MKDLVLERICPVFVGYYDTSSVLHTHSRETYGKRTVRHYELEYIVSSQDGYIVTDSIPVPVSKGDLLFRYPGMEVEGIGIYHSCFIEFDLNEFAEESDTLKRIPVIFHNREELAILSGYSTFHFCRLFKSITQLTPMQYTVRYRMQKARERLISTEDKMEAIMTKVGFHNYGYFWRTFKKLYGFSPREYRSWILRP